jgi:tetratricopeptide (TPR) repeat protein
MNCYYRGLSVAQQSHDTTSLAAFYSGIGNVYFEQENYRESIEFYHKSLLLDSASNSSIDIISMIYSLGLAHHALGELTLARHEFMTCLDQTKSDSGLQLGMIYHSLGDVLFELGEKDSSILLLDRAMTLYQKFGEPIDVILLHYSKGYEYMETNQLRKATTELTFGIEMAKTERLPAMIKEGTLLLSKAYEKSGNYKPALKMLRDHTTITDRFIDTNRPNSSTGFRKGGTSTKVE